MAKKRKDIDWNDPEQKRKWLIQALRRASYRWPGRNEAMKAARVDRGQYRCNSCKRIFGRKEIQMDHVEPVIDVHRGFTTLDDYAARLIPNVDGWQCLCKTCHKFKSAQENEIRRLTKKESRKKK